MTASHPGHRPAGPRQPAPQPVLVDAAPRKSLLLAGLLTFFLGPFGMFYTTIAGALIMLVVAVVVGILTLGAGLGVVWPICVIWGVWAGHRYNERRRRDYAARAGF